MAKEIKKVAKETLEESRGFGLKSKESWWWETSVQDKVKVRRECFKVWSLCKNAENWEKYEMLENVVKMC